MFSFLPLTLLNDVLLHAYSKGRGQESGCMEKGRGSGHETRRSGWDLEGFSFMVGSYAAQVLRSALGVLQAEWVAVSGKVGSPNVIDAAAHWPMGNQLGGFLRSCTPAWQAQQWEPLLRSLCKTKQSSQGSLLGASLEGRVRGLHVVITAVWWESEGCPGWPMGGGLLKRCHG